MPQSKIDPKNPPPEASSSHEGEPLSPTLTVSLHPLGLGSSAPEPALGPSTPRRDGPPARRSPIPAHERKRGGAQAYGPGRRFNSRHRG